MRRPLTVVQLLPALSSGGVERSTIEIAQALVDAGHRALVVSAGGRLVPVLEATGAVHVNLDIGAKSLRVLRHVGGLRRLLAETGADIVHARSRLPAWIGWWALRGMPEARRPRFVTTMHGLNSPSRYSAIMARGERVICVSDTVRDYLLRHYPATPPDRLRVIRRGIDPTRFPPTPQPNVAARAGISSRWPALGGDGPLLLLPGRGTRLKGHHDAIALLSTLRAGGLDARLWMPGAREAGRESYLEELERAADTAGCSHALAMTEPTDAIARAYAASDLVLQLSRKPEAFGRTVLEALSCARPVVGWAHGGVGELLAQLQPEGAVTPFDQSALVQTARALVTQPPRAVTMPDTLRAMQEATLAVYDELDDDN